MICILHIVIEKTGTITLQHFLHINKNALLKRHYGVLSSVGTGNNRRLASYAITNDQLDDDYLSSNEIDNIEKKISHDKSTEDLLAKEVETLRNKDCHKVLISSEHFHSRCVHDSKLNKLKK